MSNYPALLDGRDDGFAYWGQAGGGKLKWQMGIFNGIRNTVAGLPIDPNADGNYLLIGRVTVNLLDPEPGYYTQSCYFGDKEILAIGMTGAFQRDAGGVTAGQGDFWAGSIDLLWEHRLGNCGVLDVEAAFYKYNDGLDAANAAAAVAENPFGLDNQGEAEYVEISYMLPNDVCIGRMSGRVQPFTRYQYYNYDERSTIAAAGAFDHQQPGALRGIRHWRELRHLRLQCQDDARLGADQRHRHHRGQHHVRSAASWRATAVLVHSANWMTHLALVLGR